MNWKLSCAARLNHGPTLALKYAPTRKRVSVEGIKLKKRLPEHSSRIGE